MRRAVGALPHAEPGAADAGDLVLGLERADPEVLEARELVQHVTGRRDRVAAQEHGQAGALGGRDQPIGDRGVAGDLSVPAGWRFVGRDLVAVREPLGRRAEGEPGLQRDGSYITPEGDHLVDADILREFTCPNGKNWTDAIAGTPTTSYSYTITFDGFTEPAISLP